VLILWVGGSQSARFKSEKALHHPEVVWFWLPVFLSTYPINIINRKFIRRNHDHIAYGSKIESISGDLVLAKVC